MVFYLVRVKCHCCSSHLRFRHSPLWIGWSRETRSAKLKSFVQNWFALWVINLWDLWELMPHWPEKDSNIFQWCMLTWYWASYVIYDLCPAVPKSCKPTFPTKNLLCQSRLNHFKKCILTPRDPSSTKGDQSSFQGRVFSSQSSLPVRILGAVLWTASQWQRAGG